MRILSWNIQHGGAARAAAIVAAVERHNPDVIVLLESRRTSAPGICGELGGRGWRHRASTTPPGAVNGICVLSRFPLEVLPESRPSQVFARGWLEVGLQDKGLMLGAVYAPNEKRLLRSYWDAVLEHAASRAGEPYLLIGDYNAGASRVDSPNYRFMAGDHFARLGEIGTSDVWRMLNPDRTEYTWYSKRRGGAVGNGFRIDHAFASHPVASHVKSCWYSHREREDRTSDHSMLVVDVEEVST